MQLVLYQNQADMMEEHLHLKISLNSLITI